MMAERPSYAELLEESLPPKDSPLYELNRDYALRAIDRGNQIADIVEERILVKGAKVLDLGSGDGGVSIAFALRGGQATSLEMSKERIDRMMVWASEKGVEVRPVLGDALNTQLADSEYDIITCNDLLEHVADGQKLAREIDRLLKPGGVLFLETQNRLSILEFLSDSHLRLLGITLLPTRLAAFYAEKIRRRTKHYSVGKIPTPGYVLRIFKNTSVEVTQIHVEDPRRKVLDPTLLRSGPRRRVIGVVNKLGLSGIVLRFVDSWLFRFIPGSIAFVGQKTWDH